MSLPGSEAEALAVVGVRLFLERDALLAEGGFTVGPRRREMPRVCMQHGPAQHEKKKDVQPISVGVHERALRKAEARRECWNLLFVKLLPGH